MEGKEMKAKVGVVGAGTYGSVLINAYYGAHRRGEIEFAAIADINPDTLKSMDEKYGIKGSSCLRISAWTKLAISAASGAKSCLGRWTMVTETPISARFSADRKSVV